MKDGLDAIGDAIYRLNGTIESFRENMSGIRRDGTLSEMGRRGKQEDARSYYEPLLTAQGRGLFQLLETVSADRERYFAGLVEQEQKAWDLPRLGYVRDTLRARLASVSSPQDVNEMYKRDQARFPGDNYLKRAWQLEAAELSGRGLRDLGAELGRDLERETSPDALAGEMEIEWRAFGISARALLQEAAGILPETFRPLLSRLRRRVDASLGSEWVEVLPPPATVTTADGGIVIGGGETGPGGWMGN